MENRHNHLKEIIIHKEKGKVYLFIILLSIILTLISCSKEEECDCNAQFVTENGGFYTVPNLPVDCETKTPSEDNSNTGGGYFVGCKN